MCVSPYIAKTKDGKPVPVPCGHCLDCRKQYQTEWTFRLTQESKRSPVPAFVTLTYSDEHLPMACDPYTGELLSVVQKRDVQLFFKRLRKIGGELTDELRYFAIGEYGAKFNRAHYHAIIVCPNLRYISDLDKLIKRAWPFGFSMTKLANRKSIQYVCKYMNKLDEREHLEEPFRLYSRSIGLNFLTDKMIDYYLTTFSRTCKSGKATIGLPRYYKRKLDALSEQRPMLKIAGLSYTDMLEDIQPKFGTKYWYLKDFKENFEYYFECATEYFRPNSLYFDKDIDFVASVLYPSRQQVWQYYVRANKFLQDMIFDDARRLQDVVIKNELKGNVPTSYNVDSKILLEVT